MTSDRGLCSGIVGLWLLLFPSASFGFNYPDLDWKTIATPHFVIHYYDDVTWTAYKVAKVAEEIYPAVTGIYRHEPKGRTHIVVRDDEDTANGFAVFNLGYITIWASPSTLSLRGRHDWIRGVVTHEFSHVVSLQVSTGGGSLIEGLRFGGVGNADTKYNTDIGGTVLIPTHPYSRWWAEGTAQLDTAGAGHDLWDTHQDMLLRASTLENNLLDFEKMRNITVREHFGGELVYNQGFSFLLWLEQTYGRGVNSRISKQAGDRWHLDFDRNLEEVTSKPARELYREWRDHLAAKYEAQVAPIRTNPRDGRRVALVPPAEFQQGDPQERPYKDGTYNFFPRFSPDGRWFSRIDATTLELRYLDDPFVLDPPTTGDEPSSGVAPLTLRFSARYYAWAPDSRRLVLARRQSNVMGGFPYFDFFIVDLEPLLAIRARYRDSFERASDETQKRRLTWRFRRDVRALHPTARRITHRLRGTHPAWSPDGRWIAYAENRDGQRRLRLVSPDGAERRDLVALGGDAEALDPAWSPDGSRIAFTLFAHNQSDIWLVEVATNRAEPVTMDAGDDRNPAFTPDGREILFSSDRTGIFQIYRVSAEPRAVSLRPVTRVETGAFMPFPVPDGKRALYTRFSSFGFKVYEIPLDGDPPEAALAVTPPNDEAQARFRVPEEMPAVPAPRTYFPWPRPVRIFPSFISENDQVKAGVGLQLSDFLERHSLSGTALFGWEQDYQVAYQNRVWYPTLYSSYTSYIRTNALTFTSDGDDLADEPKGVMRDNIQFVEAGISQDFEAQDLLRGSHTLGIAYERRFVDRRVGIPVLLNDNLETSFRLITNDGLTLSWYFGRQPATVDRDYATNRRDATFISASYSLVRTALLNPDDTIPSPNRRYFHHEGTLAVSRFFRLPWTSPWWEHHSFWMRFNAGVKSRDVTYLDQFFLGGRLNFRAFGQISSNTLFHGYEDFSITGETLLLLSSGYTFPIVRAIDRRTGFLYWDSVYGSLFYEIGNAWTFGDCRNRTQNPSRDPDLGEGTVFLHDVGAEVRLSAFLFSDWNRWNSFVRIAYGFQDDAAHGFSDDDWPVRLYAGVGTDF